MGLSINRWTRKLHRWGALVTAIPMLLVIVTGLLLQVKKQSSWVQPPTQKGEIKNQTPKIDWEHILQVAKKEQYSEAQIESWNDIDRMDVRIGKGIVKVRAKSQWELQIDLSTGKVLQYEYRRSDFIESLHDGSFFGDFSKLFLFLGNGLILLGLWFTGAWLWYLPFQARRKKQIRKKRNEASRRSSSSSTQESE